MSNLRRYDPEGRPVFITCVTYCRNPILRSNIPELLRSLRIPALRDTELIAFCVLPDHFHALVDFGDLPMSVAVHRFKQKFSGLYRSQHALTLGRLWQHRFYDHIIRDQDDFNRKVDYIHLNPVRHGLVQQPGQWRWSSFGVWSKGGFYSPDWGILEMENGADYGE